jgi:hypothetical protein
MTILEIIILLLVLIIVGTKICENISNEGFKESFNGALQSLYSNDGIQDENLTLPSENSPHFDAYRYWRDLPWNLPTRDLDRVYFYPYLYEYNIDRYARMYPYW